MEANDAEISQLQAELAALQHEIDNGSWVSLFVAPGYNLEASRDI
jgi:hypothetical protein